MKRRIRFISWLMSFLLLLIAVRMGYLQVIRGQDLARRAAAVHVRELDQDPVRGRILDRFGIEIAGSRPARWLIADRDADPRVISSLEKLAGVRPGVYLARWQRGIKEGQVSMVLDTRAGERPALTTVKAAGIRLVPGFSRYARPALAPHLIGYLTRMGDGSAYSTGAGAELERGACGVELQYDGWLSSGENRWLELVDGRGKPITGLGPEISAGNQRPELVLTLDRRLQSRVQEIMERYKVQRGAVVVMDVVSRDVLAMASSPSFDPADVASTSPVDQPFINRALSLFHPGSIFKVVVAAAALENHLVDDSRLYRCPGYYKFPSGLTIGCWQKEGHGLLTFNQALAQSCNAAFIQIGQQVGKKALLEEVSRLRLTDNQITGFNGTQDKGVVHIEPGGPALANACLGQQGVMLSPLMVANLMATIADNGWYRVPRLALEMRLGDQIKHYFRQPPAIQVINPAVCQRLQAMLRQVVTEGTGKRAQGDWPAAGKTASSETGTEELDTWFAGYVPAEAPRLAIVVMVEKGSSGGATCAPIFKEIADQAGRIYNW